jgi:hypothetical protein
VADPKAEIDLLHQSLERLRIEFDRYFRKERKFPPLQDRNALEATLRRAGARPMVSTGDQFRFSGIQSRFLSLSSLWERQLRELEEGRAPGAPRAASAATPPPAPAPAPITEEGLDRAVDGWKTARRSCGLPANDREAAAFREMLRKKASEIAGSSGGQVEFTVSAEGGKPRIRAAVRKPGEPAAE